jgi:hypothetical protein
MLGVRRSCGRLWTLGMDASTFWAVDQGNQEPEFPNAKIALTLDSFPGMKREGGTGVVFGQH